MTRPLRVPAAALALLVAGAFAALVWSALATSEARISATTDNRSSFFSAGRIDLTAVTEPATAELLLDADGLYPGRIEQGCVEVRYGGTIDADIRLHGRDDGGTGLARYVSTTIERGRATGPGCAGFVREEVVFQGSLAELWADHGSYAEGLPLADGATDGMVFALRATVEVADDDRAQGRTASFWLVLEARP